MQKETPNSRGSRRRIEGVNKHLELESKLKGTWRKETDPNRDWKINWNKHLGIWPRAVLKSELKKLEWVLLWRASLGEAR